jgi:GntR family transcriptional repressor for pyruvate dehydrogenase complex
VHAALSQAILGGKVAAGTRLPSESALAAHFRVSRPVVRQALEQLRAEALIASVRGSGSYVQAAARSAAAEAPSVAADIGHILHGVELRLVLEPEAAALAAMRRTGADLQRLAACVEGFRRATLAGEPTHVHDYGFHEAIARATANPRLLQAMRALEFDVAHAVRVWRHLGRMKPAMRLQDAVDEHQAILDCIRAQDAEGARRAMRSHIEKARVRMMAQG